MSSAESEFAPIDRRVALLFALVSEAIATATHALLHGESVVGQSVIQGDEAIDTLTAELEQLVWQRLEGTDLARCDVRHLVGILLVLPELERSADLAEHIAQRAVSSLGADMSPLSRGSVQRMTEVALEMWHTVADAFINGTAPAFSLEEADEEIDILHDRLTAEVATGSCRRP